MSPQHDYVIDNSTGANVRSDINSALQAIVTNNSGSSAPSATFPFMLFADSAAGTMKIRNAADNAFIELFQLDGTFTLEDGSAGTPGLAFRDDLNTGIFSSAADKFNVATGGVERMELGTTTIFNESGADVDFRIESDNHAYMFFVDAGNNRIGVNTSSPAAKLAVHTHTTTNSSSQLFRITTANGALFGIETDETSSNPTWKIGGLVNTGAAEPLAFYQLGSEVARIDSSGRVGISTSSPSSKLDIGANHKFFTGSSLTNTRVFQSSNGICIRPNISGAGTNNVQGTFIKASANCSDIDDDDTVKFIVFGTGDVQNANNTYAAISDVNLKQDIVDAGSQWDDIKNLKVRKYRFKNNPTGSLQIGCIAQEAETVSPGLVDTDPDEGFKSLKYSVLYMKAIKCLQEAMAKIESLETKVEALEAA